MMRVVVVGGGVMGSSAAWHLSSRGARVTLLERFHPGHTEGSSHGTARIFRLAYADPFYVDLAARALPLWRRLEQETGTDLLTLTGEVDHGPQETIHELHRVLRTAGHPGDLLTPADAADRWPGLRFDTAVLWHPTAGRLHADHAVAAFQRAAASNGADLRYGARVVAVRAAGDSHVEVTIEDDVSLQADAAVVAVGGWAPTLIEGLPPVRVTQEQPVHFPAPNPLSWPSFIHHVDPPVYGLGTVAGVKVGLHGAGPVVDPDHRDRTPSPEALARVCSYAAHWLPGVDISRPQPETCLYTTTVDEDFLIDRIGPVTVLAGFSGHGFKFASAVGELAADLVTGSPAPARFSFRP
jgi:sarcosine oxidase